MRLTHENLRERIDTPHADEHNAGMKLGHEVRSPATDDSTPLPMQVDGLSIGAPPTTASATLTADTVLLWVAGAGGAWFPSEFASRAGVARDTLDEPLAELRLAGLVQVAEWVRGAGQGYALTPAGAAAASDPAALARLRNRPPANDNAPPLPMPTLGPVAAEAAGETNETELALRPPIVVPILLLANVAWFLVCAVVGVRWGLTLSRSLSEGHRDVLARFGAVTGTDLLNGEWWRLVTSCFVHVGALHLLGNMFALAMMGPLAELLWGRARLLVIYFVSGLAGSAVAMAIQPHVLLAGASGAIWGIQMSLFAWLFTFRRDLPTDLAGDWFRRLCVVFVLNAGVSFLPGVSWEAHLGGGLAGLATAGLLNAARYGSRVRRVFAWLMLATLPLLCVGGVWAAMDAKGMTGWVRLRERLAAEDEAREREAQQKRLTEARAAFNNDVRPRLRAMEPKAVAPVHQQAGIVLTSKKRSPERVSAVRAQVTALKAAADEVVVRTSGAPVGVAGFDQYRERVRRFAEAQSKSFGILLALLATDTPTPAKLSEWDAARKEAARRWDELNTR